MQKLLSKSKFIKPTKQKIILSIIIFVVLSFTIVDVSIERLYWCGTPSFTTGLIADGPCGKSPEVVKLFWLPYFLVASSLYDVPLRATLTLIASLIMSYILSAIIVFMTNKKNNRIV